MIAFDISGDLFLLQDLSEMRGKYSLFTVYQKSRTCWLRMLKRKEFSNLKKIPELLAARHSIAIIAASQLVTVK